MATTSLMIRWAKVLSIVGFLCGFIGPLVLMPDANQGPMLGIFITGPGGAIIGVVLGLAVDLLGITPANASRVLYLSASVVAVFTLYFCIPEPHHYTDVIDGEIHQCTPAVRQRDKALGHLNEITAAHQPLAKPILWSEKFDQELDKNPGVVIDVRLFRYCSLYEHMSRWNRGELEARPWVETDESRSYFVSYAGGDCSSYLIGGRSLFRVTGNGSIWPPAFINEMLELRIAEPLPIRDVAALNPHQDIH
jgi:hypothetical protein